MDAQPLSPEPESDADAPPEFGCPLCDRTAATDDAIYRHLQVNHRKSRLCRALIERTEVRLASAGESRTPDA
jgi:hypothetical protein